MPGLNRASPKLTCAGCLSLVTLTLVHGCPDFTGNFLVDGRRKSSIASRTSVGGNGIAVKQCRLSLSVEQVAGVRNDTEEVAVVGKAKLSGAPWVDRTFDIRSWTACTTGGD
jgi:hypothetical protein